MVSLACCQALTDLGFVRFSSGLHSLTSSVSRAEVPMVDLMGLHIHGLLQVGILALSVLKIVLGLCTCIKIIPKQVDC